MWFGLALLSALFQVLRNMSMKHLGRTLDDTIKQIIVRSDAYFADLMAYLAASLIILPLALRRSARHFSQIPRHWPSFLGMGLFTSLASVCHSLAYQLTLTSYVEAAKQAEVLFALAIGYLVFQERARVRAILPGSLVILLGMILLHLSG